MRIYDHVRTPVNSTAGRVISSGTHFNPDVKSDTLVEFDAMPKLADLRSLRKQPYFVNLSGVKKGWLTIIGVLDQKASNGGLKWVARCVCGRYCIRRNKKIKDVKSATYHFDSCAHCYITIKLKQDDFFRRTGKRMTEAQELELYR